MAEVSPADSRRRVSERLKDRTPVVARVMRIGQGRSRPGRSASWPARGGCRRAPGACGCVAGGGWATGRLACAGSLRLVAARGFDREMSVRRARLHVSGTERDYGPADVRVRDHRRFEGVSDPGDTSGVYALETVDGVRGTLVDGYNVYADPAIGD